MSLNVTCLTLKSMRVMTPNLPVRPAGAVGASLLRTGGQAPRQAAVQLFGSLLDASLGGVKLYSVLPSSSARTLPWLAVSMIFRTSTFVAGTRLGAGFAAAEPLAAGLAAPLAAGFAEAPLAAGLAAPLAA